MLPNGRIVVAVGDVVGRGLRAASVTGRLRNALRAYAFEGLEPAKVVDSLNSMLHYLDPEEMATLIYGVVDLEQRRISIVNAGHLPPVVVSPTHEATFFDRSGTPPLGARPSLRSVTHVVDLEPGSVVLFYTDGLVERRTESLNDRLEILRRLAEREGLLDDMPAELVDELTPEGTDDDVAILCMRFAVDVSRPYSIRLPAEPVQLSVIRSMLRTWLSELGVSESVTYDILVASGEACANAIEHAYGLRPGEIQVDVSRSDHRLTVSVKDQGSWRDARGENRGRGLPIMNKLASAVDVLRTNEGTDVRLTWDLREMADHR
jgi:anti-sigma regulatory factor (Ser/Thr protein kinase)